MKMSISTETIENEPQIIRHPALSWWHTFMHALLIERAVSWYNLQIWAAHWLQLGTHVRCQQQQQHHNHAHTAHHNYYVVSPDMTAHYALPLHTSLGSRDTWLVLSPHTDTSPRSSYNNGQETQFIILDRRMKVLKHVSTQYSETGWHLLFDLVSFGLSIRDYLSEIVVTVVWLYLYYTDTHEHLHTAAPSRDPAAEWF